MRNAIADKAVKILGVKVHATSMDRAVSRIESLVASGDKGYVCVTGVHGIMEAQVDPNLKRIINNAALNIPDGRPTVWVGWLRGLFQMRQVTGPDMMLKIFGISAAKGYTHFFYGGNTGVAEQLRDELVGSFPGAKVVGTYTPPFRALNRDEEADLIRTVAELKPDFFWVGLSTPKQEKFMDAYLSKLDVKLMLSVGAAFDIHTGRIKDAPYWMKLAGVQWCHRMYQDPSRLWRRYCVNNPKFLFYLALEFLGLATYEGTADARQHESRAA